MSAKSALKTEIKRLASESRALRAEAYKLAGEPRHHVWLSKRSLGKRTRDVLLAYACLRGMPYRRAEASCAPTNTPWASSIHRELCQALDDATKQEWPVERVRAWLAETPAVAEAA